MDIHIGYDRTEPFHFEGHGGERRECPFCSWYIETPAPKVPDLRDPSPVYRIEWVNTDKICEDHLRDAHADEPEVQRAIAIERQRNGQSPAVICPTCGATWGRIATYQCDGPREKPHPRVRTVPYVD